MCTFTQFQLKCVGGTAANEFKPQVVQCYNRGGDGYDVQVSIFERKIYYIHDIVFMHSVWSKPDIKLSSWVCVLLLNYDFELI